MAVAFLSQVPSLHQWSTPQQLLPQTTTTLQVHCGMPKNPAAPPTFQHFVCLLPASCTDAPSCDSSHGQAAAE